MGSSSSSRELAVVRGPLLAGSDHRGAEPEPAVSYLSTNAVIRTDGAVKMTKPPSGKRKGELDLSSVKSRRGSSMLLDYLAFIVKLGICCSLICKERHQK